MNLVCRIPEGGLIPKWYGRAYWAFDSMFAVCYPVPLNLFVRFGRHLWYLLKAARGHIADERIYQFGYARGRQHFDIGYRAGFEDGWEYFAQNVLQMIDAETSHGKRRASRDVAPGHCAHVRPAARDHSVLGLSARDETALP